MESLKIEDFINKEFFTTLATFEHSKSDKVWLEMRIRLSLNVRTATFRIKRQPGVGKAMVFSGWYDRLHEVIDAFNEYVPETEKLRELELLQTNPNKHRSEYGPIARIEKEKRKHKLLTLIPLLLLSLSTLAQYRAPLYQIMVNGNGEYAVRVHQTGVQPSWLYVAYLQAFTRKDTTQWLDSLGVNHPITCKTLITHAWHGKLEDAQHLIRNDSLYEAELYREEEHNKATLKYKVYKTIR